MEMNSGQKKAAAAAFAVTLGSGCVGMPTTVDSFNRTVDQGIHNIKQTTKRFTGPDANASQLEKDCHEFAKEKAGVGTEIVKDTTIGALLGAIPGYAMGNTTAGAAAGAAGGAVYGANEGGSKFDTAFHDCMQNNGGNVDVQHNTAPQGEKPVYESAPKHIPTYPRDGSGVGNSPVPE